MKKLIGLGLLLCAGLVAQEAKPLIYVAFYKVHPDKGGQWTDGMKKLFVPVMDKLMAKGAVLSYGLDEDMLHRVGETNHDAWWAMPNLAAYDQVVRAVDEAFAKQPEDLANILDAQDVDQHYDLLFRTVASSGQAVPAGSLPVERIATYTAKPGKSEEMDEAFNHFFKPLYDGLVADGTIHGYSWLASAVHNDDVERRWLVVSMPNWGAFDKVIAKFGEDDQQRSKAENDMLEALFEGIGEDTGHEDWMIRATVFKSSK